MGLFDKFKKKKKAKSKPEALGETGSDSKVKQDGSSKEKKGPLWFFKHKFRIKIKGLNIKRKNKPDAESDEDTVDPPKKKGVKAKKEKKAKKPKDKKQKSKKKSDDGEDSGGSDEKSPKIPIVAFMIIASALIIAGGAAAVIMHFFMNQPTVEEQLLRASLLMSESKYVEAADAYSKIAKKNKTLVAAYLGVAEAELAQENSDAAIQTLTDALEPTANDPLIQAKIDELTKPEETADPGEPPPPSTEPIVWKDAAFEKMVHIAIGKTGNEPISESDLDGITTLKILGNTHAATNENIPALIRSRGYEIDGVIYEERGQIKTLADIIHFKKLRKLTVAYNSITDISALSDLTQLETLGLYFNEIQNISSLKNIETLKFLYIYDNQITDISPISGLSGLEQLWLSNNKITSISAVKDLKNLTEIFINNNEISDISSISGLPKLGFFYAENNSISDVSAVKDMESLTDVSFAGNPVTDYSPTKHIDNVNKPFMS